MSQTKRAANKKLYALLAIAFWLILWELCSLLIPAKILFASPDQVINVLFGMIRTSSFWTTILYSASRIAFGFILAFVMGVLFASLSAACQAVRILLLPLMRLMKAVPVASFIILALLWIRSSGLSVLISFVMVLPVIYTNVLQGIDGTDKKLLEMADVFRIPVLRRIRYIYLPSVMPALVSACSVALGFCWKSGIAAEVIGQPTGSIGERLYEAKLYLMTGELFAWTAVIVLVSVLFEKIVMLLIRTIAGKLS
jgi:NitT/TauT family transport system permease protein